MPSSHLILCRPLFLLPPTPPNIRVFSNESTLLMRWPKYWSFSFSMIPSKEHGCIVKEYQLFIIVLYTHAHSKIISGFRFPNKSLRCKPTLRANLQAYILAYILRRCPWALPLMPVLSVPWQLNGPGSVLALVLSIQLGLVYLYRFFLLVFCFAFWLAHSCIWNILFNVLNYVQWENLLGYLDLHCQKPNFINIYVPYMGFLNFSTGIESACNSGDTGNTVQSLDWEDPLEEDMATHSSILAWKKKFPGQRVLGGYSPKGCKELDMTEWISTHVPYMQIFNVCLVCIKNSARNLDTRKEG